MNTTYESIIKGVVDEIEDGSLTFGSEIPICNGGTAIIGNLLQFPDEPVARAIFVNPDSFPCTVKPRIVDKNKPETRVMDGNKVGKWKLGGESIEDVKAFMAAASKVSIFRSGDVRYSLNSKAGDLKEVKGVYLDSFIGKRSPAYRLSASFLEQIIEGCFPVLSICYNKGADRTGDPLGVNVTAVSDSVGVVLNTLYNKGKFAPDTFPAEYDRKVVNVAGQVTEQVTARLFWLLSFDPSVMDKGTKIERALSKSELEKEALRVKVAEAEAKAAATEARMAEMERKMQEMMEKMAGKQDKRVGVKAPPTTTFKE